MIFEGGKATKAVISDHAKKSVSGYNNISDDNIVDALVAFSKGSEYGQVQGLELDECLICSVSLSILCGHLNLDFIILCSYNKQ